MGITGAIATVDPQALEACVRDILNIKAPRLLFFLKLYNRKQIRF